MRGLAWRQDDCLACRRPGHGAGRWHGHRAGSRGMSLRKGRQGAIRPAIKGLRPGSLRWRL